MELTHVLLTHSRYGTLKVEALETSNGVKVGDRVVFGGYKNIAGNIEPLVPCTVNTVTYILGHGLSYYRLECSCDAGQLYGRIEGAENHFQKD